MTNKLQKIGNLSIPLILGVIFALLWANIDFDSYNGIVNHKFFSVVSLSFIFNDIFMAFFFGLAAVEIVYSLNPGGNLHPIKKAVPTLFATTGGVLGPIAVFFILNHLIGSQEYTNGWAIPTATDVAVALLFVRMVFGRKHPAISFLLLLAVLDDAVGMLIIAIFYPDPSHPAEYMWLLLVITAMFSAFLFNRTKVTSYWWYIIIPGIMSWIGMFKAGLHPSLALVFIVPFMLKERNKFSKKLPTIKKFEHDFKMFVDYGLFFFGIANAGVLLSGMSELTLIIFASLLLGKTFGIWGFAEFAKLLGFSLPNGIGCKEMILLGVVASVGLTVSLFISGAAYTDIDIQGAAKMGALLSVICGFLAIYLSKLILKKIKPKIFKKYRLLKIKKLKKLDVERVK